MPTLNDETVKKLGEAIQSVIPGVAFVLIIFDKPVTADHILANVKDEIAILAVEAGRRKIKEAIKKK